MNKINLPQAAKLTSPNPVSVVCTMKPDGSTNLATVSWWTYLSFNPNMIAYAMAKTSYSGEMVRNTKKVILTIPGAEIACSKLYGAAVKAGRAMGYTRFITYTLPEEGGSSVKAAGFHLDGIVPERKDGWHRNNRRRNIPSRTPAGPKLRWVLDTRPTQDHGNCDE